MLIRTILGVVGIMGLAAGVWILADKGRSLETRTTLREHFHSWLLTPDSFMAAIGWATWMGLFGGLVSFSITGQTIA